MTSQERTFANWCLGWTAGAGREHMAYNLSSDPDYIAGYTAGQQAFLAAAQDERTRRGLGPGKIVGLLHKPEGPKVIRGQAWPVCGNCGTVISDYVWEHDSYYGPEFCSPACGEVARKKESIV